MTKDILYTLCILVSLLLPWIFLSKIQAQTQPSSVGDTVHIFPALKISDTTFPGKNRIKASSDSLKSAKDSIGSLLSMLLRSDTTKLPKDSLNNSLNSRPGIDSAGKLLLSGMGYDPEKMHKDSLIKKLQSIPGTELKKQVDLLKQTTGSLDKETLSKKLSSLIPIPTERPTYFAQIGGGFINYNYMFRSAIDTPYMEQNMGQHLVNAGVDVAIADLPFQLSYYGRQSNSAYLRDYHDFRFAFNVPAFHRLRQDQLRNKLNSLINQIQTPGLTDNIQGLKDKIQELQNRLNGTELINQYLKAKQNIAYADQLPDEIGDKAAYLDASRNLINSYEQQGRALADMKSRKDSLESVFSVNAGRIQQLKKMISGNMYTDQGVEIIREKLNEEGVIDKKTERLLKTMYAVRSFAIGRTLPYMSNLTVKNVNVSGINFEYNADNFYTAFTAGKIDFRSRDFIYGRSVKVPQYVYAAALGYGRKDGNHLIVTGYTGKKQIVSNIELAAFPVTGMSIEGQWLLGKYVRVTAEAAQSTSPVHASTQGTQKQGFKMNDNTNKAYSIQVAGYLPSTGTKWDGYYQRTGINFQNFTNYRVNANASTWSFRVEQYLWRKQIRLLAAARKNDYSNPFVIQQYNSNTVFTSFSATFRRRKLPSLTIGYIPSSQYTIVGNLVAESRYQSLNISSTHFYRIGLMTANGTFTYNKFYNSGSDTGFLYYNANNFFTRHQFAFQLFTANMGYTRTANKQYALDVMDGGLMIHYAKYFTTGMGVKINSYNSSEVKTGWYYNLSCKLKMVGDFNLWYERGYLPGTTNTLIKNEWFTLGFTRYFNNSIKL